jgi:hypothetical protein
MLLTTAAPEKEPMNAATIAGITMKYGNLTTFRYLLAAINVPPIDPSLFVPNRVAGLAFG